jgi:hypothetical protein
MGNGTGATFDHVPLVPGLVLHSFINRRGVSVIVFRRLTYPCDFSATLMSVCCSKYGPQVKKGDELVDQDG